MDSPSPSSSSGHSYSQEESRTLALKVKLLELELQLREQSLREAIIKTDELELSARYERLKNDSLVVTLEDGTSAPVSSSAGKPLSGIVPEMPHSKGFKRVVIKLPYRLEPEAQSELKTRFPTVLFDYDTQVRHHDHPVAHAETAVASRLITQQINLGEKWLDLYGNPNMNAGFNKDQVRSFRPKRIDTIVHAFTESDFYRKSQKWGAEFDESGNARWVDATVPELLAEPTSLAGYSGILMVHTLYYLTDESLVRLVNHLPAGAVLRAVVHRHKAGTHEEPVTTELFKGEITYSHNGDTVVQTNNETGYSYNHRSIEVFWKHPTKVLRTAFEGKDGKAVHQAITWDMEKVTKDTWILSFVACPAMMDEGIANRVSGGDARSPLVNMWRVFGAENQRVPTVGDTATLPVPSRPFETAKVARFGNLWTLAVPHATKLVTLKDAAFLEHLEKQIAGNVRDEGTLKTLYQVARRDVKGSQYPGSNKFDIPASEITNYVTAAFIKGVDSESENLGVLALKAANFKEHKALSSGFSNVASGTYSVTNANWNVRTLGKGAAFAARLAGNKPLAARIEDVL